MYLFQAIRELYARFRTAQAKGEVPKDAIFDYRTRPNEKGNEIYCVDERDAQILAVLPVPYGVTDKPQSYDRHIRPSGSGR